MMNQTTNLQIGDEIGFVSLAADIDDNDKVVFFPIVEITTRDGERAYHYQYPDGEVSRSAIKESNLDHYTIKIKPRTKEMICLNERQAEFKSALKRGLENDLAVLPDFERDCFIVENRTNKSKYQVKLDHRHGQIFAKCGCEDFIYRKRLCKHISQVLVETFFGVVESMGVVLYDK